MNIPILSFRCLPIVLKYNCTYRFQRNRDEKKKFKALQREVDKMAALMKEDDDDSDKSDDDEAEADADAEAEEEEAEAEVKFDVVWLVCPHA